MKLSIIIPVYNEEKTVGQVVKKVTNVRNPGVEKEIIVVDDGSTDKTIEVVSQLESKIADLTFVQHKKNAGKGAAIRTGIEKAKGEYILIQDADLEYNPDDIGRLLGPIQQKKATVVYGSRLQRLPNFKRDERNLQFFSHYVGNRFLSLLTSILYGQWITDMETCYKLFPRRAVIAMKLRARGFDFEPEITAKLLRAGYHIVEVPISTNPRGYDEGKKIHAVKDGLMALWSLVKYRFIH